MKPGYAPIGLAAEAIRQRVDEAAWLAGDDDEESDDRRIKKIMLQISDNHHQHAVKLSSKDP